MTKAPVVRVRTQIGAASAEYAAVTAIGVGFVTILWKFLSSGFGQQLLEAIFTFLMTLVGVKF